MSKVLLFIACLLVLWATSGSSESASLSELDLRTDCHISASL